MECQNLGNYGIRQSGRAVGNIVEEGIENSFSSTCMDSQELRLIISPYIRRDEVDNCIRKPGVLNRGSVIEQDNELFNDTGIGPSKLRYS